MIDRENLGVVEIGWPRFSVPRPVENKWYELESRLSPEVKAYKVGFGYHNAGWAYIEIEIQASSYGRALEEAERLNMEIMWAYQNRKESKVMTKCKRCGKEMNPVEVMLGPVCGECCRENHKKAIGGK